MVFGCHKGLPRWPHLSPPCYQEQISALLQREVQETQRRMQIQRKMLRPGPWVFIPFVFCFFRIHDVWLVGHYMRPTQFGGGESNLMQMYGLVSSNSIPVRWPLPRPRKKKRHVWSTIWTLFITVFLAWYWLHVTSLLLVTLVWQCNREVILLVVPRGATTGDFVGQKPSL